MKDYFTRQELVRLTFMVKEAVDAKANSIARDILLDLTVSEYSKGDYSDLQELLWKLEDLEQ